MTISGVPVRRIGEWLGLANTAGLLVWLGVFMNWAQFRIGSFDAGQVGGSTLLWPFLVLATSALALLGAARWWRWLALLVVVPMAGILADEALSALRDGEVSAFGIRLGAVMGAELLIALGAAVAVLVDSA